MINPQFNVHKHNMPLEHIQSWIFNMITDNEFNDLIIMYNPELKQIN
jgi:hypothetical protein